ncbi:hypothetical protein BD626DRAFT_629649 [Schizophyllum amplum]|uniref:NmrA-like domain-containing protein n=1 Tax=Schizophyllum amplum TaxID=97359 RepID=A0A550CGF1_9AGAR|nr:hypothetical protein BD626DRAFT_629649 [Auriculariopsis ampla]
MSPRIATVFMATGVQGSSAIRALLKDGTFTLRAVTRNANSEAARALGCEVVEATFGDKDAIKKAVTGAECVFLVTMPFAELSEVNQGKNVIDACKEAGVKFVAFSTLPSVNDISGGKYTHAIHFDEKAKVQKYLEASGIACASICPGSFLENIHRGMLGCPFTKTDTGYELTTRERPGSSSIKTWTGHDMGPAVAALFTQYATRSAEIDKKTFVLGSQKATTEETAAELAKGLGAPVTVKHLGAMGVFPVDDMYDFSAEFEWFPGVEVPDKRLEALGVKVGSIEEFARTELKKHIGA